MQIANSHRPPSPEALSASEEIRLLRRALARLDGLAPMYCRTLESTKRLLVMRILELQTEHDYSTQLRR